MTKTLFKDILRSVAANRMKFVSLVVIVALGVSFFVGIKSASPEMRDKANDYFTQTNLLDVRITSPIALTDEDISKIEALNGVDYVVKSKYIDALAVVGKKSLVDTNGSQLSCRVRPLNVSAANEFAENGTADSTYVNRLVLESGRFPQKQGECVVDSRAEEIYDGITLGETITVTGDKQSLSETLRTNNYTVVGTVSSPMYISVERGNSQIGSGTLGAFIYVGSDDFVSQETNEAFVKINNSQTYDKFSQEYNTLVENLSYEIVKMSSGIIDSKLSDVKADYSDRIASKEKEIEDYSSSSKKTLEEKKKSIKEFKEYVDNEDTVLAELTAKSNKQKDDNKNSLDNLVNRLKTLNATYESNVKAFDNMSSEIKGYSELKSMYDDLDNKHTNDSKTLSELKGTRDSALSTLDSKKDNVSKINSSISGYESSAKSTNSKISSLQNNLAAYKDNVNTLEAKISSLKSDISSLEKSIKELEDKSAEGKLSVTDSLNLKNYRNSLATKNNELNELNSDLSSAKSLVSSTNNKINDAKKDLSVINSNLSSARNSLSSAKSEQSAAQNNYDSAQKIYSSFKSTYDADSATLNKYMSSMKQLTDGKSDISRMSKTIDDQKKNLDELKISVTQAQIKYTLSQKNADSEIVKVQADLDAAKGKYSTIDTEYDDLNDAININLENLNGDLKKLNNMLKNADSLTWSVTPQTELTGHEGFVSSLDNVDSMSLVFPLIFIFTAMIACFAIMIKNIEVERNEIGVLKALGYSDITIMFKYLIYAGIACILGTVIGIIFGSCLFPPAIYSIYRTIYNIPEIGIVFNIKYMFYGFIIAVGTTFVATIVAGAKELIHFPAVLLRPKAIYYNKRTIVERFPMLWQSMSYGMIFIMRAISRSRKRVIASTIGIACCTALILSAFGLANSVSDITKSQFGRDGVFSYDVQMILNSDQSDDSDILNQVKEDKRTKNAMLMCSTTVTGSSSTDVDAVKRSVHVFVPYSIQSAYEFVNTTAVSGSDNIEQGTVITEKFAEDIGAKVGSTIYLTDMEGNVHSTAVTGIVKNYINNYVYLSPKNYEDIFLTKPQFKYIVCTLKDYMGEKEIKNYSAEFLKNDEVVGSATTGDMDKSVDASFNRVIAVVIIFIISACLLATIVMYTVTNININERKREIANIKVVGFSDSEVLIYVNRENIISFIIGVVMGLVGGIFLHKALISFISVDSIMYGNNIYWWSFLATILIVSLGELISILPMRLIINKVNMAETLKTEE